MLTPWTVFLWLSGVVWLLVSKTARPFRFLGVLYLVYLPMMMLLHAKDYYLAPVYPIYFAAGGMCWLPMTRRSITRNVLVGAYALLLIVGFFLTIPFSIPVLPPQKFVAWSKTMHFQPKDTENHDATILPQFYADRFGWHEMVEKVAAIYNALPPDQRAVTGIYTGNYGEASAINLFGPKYGLPVAISGHQTYWLWGPHGYTGQEMIIINGATLDEDEAVLCLLYGGGQDATILSPCPGRRSLIYPLPWQKSAHIGRLEGLQVLLLNRGPAAPG